MSVVLTNSTSGLFDLLGAIFKGADEALTLAGTTVPARYGTLATFFSAASLVKVLDGFESTVTAEQSASSGYVNALVTLAGQTLVSMVNADYPLPSQDVTSALNQLIVQMLDNATTVNASVPTAGSQTAIGTPVGSPIIVMSVKNVYGQTTAYSLPEKLTFTCTQDANTGGATKWQEGFTVQSPQAVSSTLDPTWPGGSAINVPLSAVDFDVDNLGSTQPGGLLNNGSFSLMTATNNFDNWVVPATSGTLGTDIVNGGTAGGIRSIGSIEFHCDASTNHAITQQFGTAPSTALGAGGTAAVLLPDTQYAVNFWLKGTGTALSAGVLTVDLVDGTNTVIADDAGTNNAFTKALSGITSLVNVSGTFRTPKSLTSGSTVKLRIRESTAGTSGANLFISGVEMQAMTQLYPGGPSAAIFAGAAAPNSTGLLQDAWTVTMGQTFGTVQKWLERFFGMKARGLQIPQTTSSPTVADAVVA